MTIDDVDRLATAMKKAGARRAKLTVDGDSLELELDPAHIPAPPAPAAAAKVDPKSTNPLRALAVDIDDAPGASR